MQQKIREAVSPVLETTKQETDIRARWGWVEASVWTGRMLAALESGVKGERWFSLMDKVYAPATLCAAWEKVKASKGGAGIDRMSVEKFEAKRGQYLSELHESLKAGSYRPLPVKRVHIPKSDGSRRPLGIPAVKDRIVQAALKRVIEPVFENEFADTSYGFRPGRGCKQALGAVDAWLKEGLVWVVDADLKSYFDTIPHSPLLDRVEARISDGSVLGLIGQFLEQSVMDGLESWTPTAGTPQGAVLSPLLANLYLHPLDELVRQAGVKMVRYADDFVLLCRTEAEAQQALDLVREWVAANGLALHPDKTHVGNCMVKGQGFEFLGYRFEGGRRFVRKKSFKALKDKIRSRTKRTCGSNIRMVIQEINPILKGWFNYFKHAHRTTFAEVDGFVRRRLRGILCKQNNLSYYFHRSLANHRRWRNAYFTEHGLFTLKEAHVAACQSR